MILMPQFVNLFLLSIYTRSRFQFDSLYDIRVSKGSEWNFEKNSSLSGGRDVGRDNVLLMTSISAVFAG